MTQHSAKGIIADDEDQLRTYLKRLLSEVWPELKICAEAGNGREALDAIESCKPQVAFLDIRMPGLSGLQVAEKIARSCHIVFVTAYDEYAVEAFEKEAVDYLLKPVVKERLAQTIERLKKQLNEAKDPPLLPEEFLQSLANHVASSATASFLQWLRVSHGDGIQLIAVKDVVYFQAKDKYTAVFTQNGEFLIRKSIRELNSELDSNCFCQIHRSTIVSLSQIEKVSRSITGRGVIRLKNRPEPLTISRSYLNRFRQM